MTDVRLSADESEFVRLTSQGLVCDLSVTDGQPMRTVQAEVIQRLLSRRPLLLVDEDQARTFDAYRGVRLKGARIDGELDLEGARSANGEPLPAMVLEACTIPGQIKLSRARLQFLSLAGSRINHLDARFTQIVGPVDLSGLGSAGGPGANGQGLCHLDLRGIEIDGDLDLNRSRLVAPPRRADYSGSRERAVFALTLAGAHVRNTILLEPHFSALGGVSMSDAHIAGDVWARGAALEAVESYDAFRGQNAVIDGVLIMSVYDAAGDSPLPAKVVGDIGMLGLRAGMVVFSGLQLTGDLGLVNASIAGDLQLNGEINVSTSGSQYRHLTNIDGVASLQDTTVGTNFSLFGAYFRNYFHAQNLKVGNDITASVTHDNRESTFLAVFVGAANFTQVQIDKDAIFTRCIFENDIHFDGAVIGGCLIFGGSTVEQRFLGINLRVGRDLFFGGHVGKKLVVKKECSMWGANIGGDFEIIDADFQDGLRMDALELAGNLTLSGVSVSGGQLSLRGAAIGRALRVRNFECNGVAYLAGARVRGLDDLHGAGWRGSGRLDLDGFRYERLETPPHPKASLKGIWNHLPRWIASAIRRFWLIIRRSTGSLIAISILPFLFAALLSAKLWGFAAAVATLFMLIGATIWTRSKDHEFTSRLRWLNRIFTSGVPIDREYTPEPFVHLVRTLRVQGRFDEARRVASRRMELERRLVLFPLFKPFLSLFEFFFDYGLSSGQALMTFFLFLFIGWGGAQIASRGEVTFGSTSPVVVHVPATNYSVTAPGMGFDWKAKGPILVVSSSTVSSVAAPGSSSGQMHPTLIYAAAENAVPGELPCGDAIDPRLYALETFVPALELHQSAKCEVSARPDADGWRWARALYSALGWIITSLTILTVSGVLRRDIEA